MYENDLSARRALIRRAVLLVVYTLVLLAVACNAAYSQGAAGPAADAVADARHSVAIRQAMPNPFNVATDIGFWLAERQYVTLKIYNLSGEEVATLVNEVLGAGEHTIRWDGSDGHGHPLPNGAYVCRAQSGEAVDSKTIILMR
jgi:hypothetical protein